MFLDMTIQRNPNLITAAAHMHRQGLIEPNSYVLDVEAITRNARAIKEQADRYGICLYYMTKQFGRNPGVAKLIEGTGITKAVAVDVEEAKTLYKNGLTIGHVGHLVQVPTGDLTEVLAMEPEVITCFSLEKAKQLAEKAQETGRNQAVLLKVVGKDDFIYPGQAGGIRIEDLKVTAQGIMKFSTIQIIGVTSFPCLLFDDASGEFKPTPNLQTLAAAKQILTGLGIKVTQVNGPSGTSCATIPLLAQSGITHGEPGHALLGTTPLHARSIQPEIPALVYVSEISHLGEGKTFCFGGGFYSRSNIQKALVATDPDRILNHKLLCQPLPAEVIDYYGTLITDEQPVHIGDTVIFSFRTQIFVTRAKVVLVAGIAANHPRIIGIYDAHGNPYL
jgi:predicted amino acid racemase